MLRSIKLQKFLLFTTLWYLVSESTFNFPRKSDYVLFSLIIFLLFISFLIFGRIITKQPSFYSTEKLFRLTFKSMLFVNFSIVCLLFYFQTLFAVNFHGYGITTYTNQKSFAVLIFIMIWVNKNNSSSDFLSRIVDFYEEKSR